MSPERLQHWRELCAYLEERPYNAAYSIPPEAHAYLTTTSAYVSASRYGSERHRRAKAIEDERRQLQVIYWATGFGWRLRKDYREKLDAVQVDEPLPLFAAADAQMR